MFHGNRVVAHTGVAYPIFQAPMTFIARAPLVAAVAEAGGLGLLETSSADLNVTTHEFTAIRKATDKPFGVNLPVQMLKRDLDEEKAIIAWLLDQGIRFVTTSAGDPSRYIEQLKNAGVIVYHATATLHGAIKAVAAGVDGVVVEGAESAGIRNPDEIHSFALLQAVRENVDVPIVAAGGIVDGRGMAAAFALGAEGVAMGTRFVASAESPVHTNYKDAIVAAPSAGTLITDLPPRARFRGLKTEYAIEAHEGRRERRPTRSVLQDLYVDGDVDNTSGPAGESSGLIHKVETVKQIIDDTVSGFWREIDRLAALRG
ncbi:nitronate monooxygenase family protein [soil metagenome]